ncbi:hypothetical protein TNCV_117661 [Trichonephila clavipes]|nr:hypothetical protein TNCV_117661 [Trichonephila clavipes]
MASGYDHELVAIESTSIDRKKIHQYLLMNNCLNYLRNEVGLLPEMDSRLERKSSTHLLVICWDHRL